MCQSKADKRATRIETFAAGYETLINEVHPGLRQQLYYLGKAGYHPLKFCSRMLCMAK